MFVSTVITRLPSEARVSGDVLPQTEPLPPYLRGFLVREVDGMIAGKHGDAVVSVENDGA
jgi:hypothetical protein